MKTISGSSRSGYWSFLTAEAMYLPCVMTTGSTAAGFCSAAACIA